MLLADIPQGHSAFDRVVPEGDLDFDPWLALEGPVAVHLEVDRHGDQITVRGQATGAGGDACARCMEPARVEMAAEFILLWERRGADSPRDEAALEEEGEVLYHEGHDVDLKDHVREALIIEIPQVVVCREGCLGLCPQCGLNRNEQACSCQAPEGDPRWSALRDLETAKGDLETAKGDLENGEDPEG